MREVLEQLRRLQKTSRLMLIAQRVAVLLAIALGITVVVALIDFVLRMPSEVRWIIWLAGLFAFIWCAATYVRSAFSFQPSLTTLALRIEKLLPRLSGRLASSIEFATAHVDDTNALAKRAMTETERRIAGETMRSFVRASRTVSALGLLLATIALCATFILTTPANALIGTQRVLTPWTSVNWPARTAVRSLMQQVITPSGVYEKGQGMVLRAAVTRGSLDQRVDAMVRYQVGEKYERWQRLVLTHQSDGIHERLIDTNADAVEIYFETADAQTESLRVELVPAPAVERATLEVTPPDYARAVVPALTEELGQGTDDRSVSSFASLMGSDVTLTLMMNKTLPVPTDDEEAGPWLAETLGWNAETPPRFDVDDENGAVWRLRWRVDQTVNLNLNLVDQYGLTNSEAITYRVSAQSDRAAAVTITEPAADQVVLPTATTLLEAEADDDVALVNISLEAKVQKAAEVRSASEPAPPVEEVKVVWTREKETTEKSTTFEQTIDLAPLGLAEGDVVLITAIAKDSYELDGQQHEPSRSAVRRLQVISELDYAEQIRRQLAGIRQNSIRIESLQGELQDDVEDEGVQPGVSRAQAQIGQRIAEQRKMISRLTEDINRNRLDDEQLQNLLEQSADMLDYAGRASASASQMIEQRSQSGQSGQSEAGEQARESQENSQAERSEREAREDNNNNNDNNDNSNRGDNQSSQGAGQSERPRETASGQQGGGDNRQSASEQSGGGSQPNRSEDENRDSEEDDNDRAANEEDREITDAQQQVRDELSDLIELLDRDEDTWVITRQLEGLLEEQKQLTEDTGKLGQQTVGRPASELTDRERTELERIVEKQTELSDAARKLMEESRQRAEAMEDVDPQSAEGMRNAAKTAEEQELDREMQRAAQRAQQNQMNSAQSAQQNASRTLQQMLDDIDQTKRAEAQQLLRQLASLIESIERLISVQENELIALAQALGTSDYSGRDRAMIRLNQNTMAVENEARTAGQSARRIARSLDRAGDAQGEAVSALRAEPLAHDEANAAEERSLELLQEAKTMADELAQQTQEDETRRQREQLIEKYRELSERQVAVRTETAPLAEPDVLDRRQLVEARRLGTSQDQIRTELSDMRATTGELHDAQVFSHVHNLIDDWSTEASESMWKGEVTGRVLDRQQQIAISIGLLIDALQETITPPDEFARDQQQPGGGEGAQGGQDPLIPPIAEIKLVRNLQEMIYNQTKSIEGGPTIDTTDRQGRLRELGRMQRELIELGNDIIKQFQRNQPQPQGEPEIEGPS